MAALLPRLSCKLNPILPVRLQQDHAKHCLQYPPPTDLPFSLVVVISNCLSTCCDIPLHRLDYGDSICDGFYEPLGDFPEIVEKGNFPTLGQLRHVQSFEQDSREVCAA
jgi:hypothetical protein